MFYGKQRMSKILVIPDVHCRKFWRKVIDENISKVDKVVFLGDYLDPYLEEIHENPELMEVNNFYDSENALKMLEDIVALKKNEPFKYVLLTGNHTDSYIWPTFERATRTDIVNYEKYHNFFWDNIDLFQMIYINGNTIFSHAGISEGWRDRVYDILEFPEDELISTLEIAEVFQDTPLKMFTKEYISLISEISRERGGDYIYGSCEWADIKEHVNKILSYDPLKIEGKGEEGIFQVFGHTQLRGPLICDKWACLDCRRAFIVEGHEISECNI